MARSIKAARQARKLTLRELAARLGVSPQTALNYEQGVTRPDGPTFALLKKLLRISGELEEWFPEHVYARNWDKKCSVEGCERDAVSKGMCRHHYFDAWRRGRGKVLITERTTAKTVERRLRETKKRRP